MADAEHYSKHSPITILLQAVIILFIVLLGITGLTVLTNYMWITAVNGKPLIPIGNYDSVIEDYMRISITPAHIHDLYDSNSKTIHIIDCRETSHPVTKRTVIVITDNGSEKQYDCGLNRNIIVIDDIDNIDKIIVKVKLCGHSGCTEYTRVLWERGENVGLLR